MRHTQRIFPIHSSILVTTLLVSLLCGCWPKSREDAQKTTPIQWVGKNPFPLNPKDVTQLTLVKADPTTDDRWMASFRPVAPTGENRGQTRWEISSAPEKQPVLDREADATFILHLLDLIQSIRVDELAPRGTLESFGLAPPLFAVGFKTASENQEFFVGNAKGDQSFISFGNTTYLASGAALKMIRLIRSFQNLRRTSWTTLTPDDIDEIFVSKLGKPLLKLYAQREGERWTDIKHQTLQKNMDEFLEQIILSHVSGFNDDAAFFKQIQTKVLEHPIYEIKLVNRHGNTTVLKLGFSKNILYGWNSSRPNSVFALSNELLKAIQKVSF